jgi:hypothetical protein
MQVAVDQSRWDLDEALIHLHLARAERYIRLALNDPDNPLAAIDPNGEAAIERSKHVRRDALRGRGRHDLEWVTAMADAQFGIRPTEDDPLLRLAPQLPGATTKPT